jgi:hypothetical protein
MPSAARLILADVFSCWPCCAKVKVSIVLLKRISALIQARGGKMRSFFFLSSDLGEVSHQPLISDPCCTVHFPFE